MKTMVIDNKEWFYGYIQDVPIMYKFCNIGEDIIELFLMLNLKDKSLINLHMFNFSKPEQYMKDNIISSSYSLMKKAEAFAKKHVNEGVRITRCDDDVHASSSILYIPHETKIEYWGTSLVIIPQMGNPSIIFLYPRHASKMIEVLSEINNRFVELA